MEAVCEMEDELELTDEQEHALWRIAQEALNNCKSMRERTGLSFPPLKAGLR